MGARCFASACMMLNADKAVSATRVSFENAVLYARFMNPSLILVAELVAGTGDSLNYVFVFEFFANLLDASSQRIGRRLAVASPDSYH